MSVYDLKQFQVSRAESSDQYNALFAHALYSIKIERHSNQDGIVLHFTDFQNSATLVALEA
ncbi:hypothetical protein A245_26728 [Pseudomonas syringae pv. actinidiae ICMP 19096]|uniref:Uncharacterized protein n=1 Tax=Pseudomonas syringae pv. actinidiae ICMP 19096 TaxID=1194405 RepID=A0A656JT76_PSESF|nr:hypothetical protein A245_26728 [Pseudomonas syringae pv. actinidiae ICMP 19096]